MSDRASGNPPLRVVITASEAVPFSKTGGLADVAGALAGALAERGVEVSLFVPNHRGSRAAASCTDSGLRFNVPVGQHQVPAEVLCADLPGSSARVFLIDQPAFFDRSGVYNDGNQEYDDNCERFVFFCRAAMETVRRLDLRPDILHANDWQTGLIPALLRAEYRGLDGFERTRSVFTIHNLAYQGRFPQQNMDVTGLDWGYYNWQQMEAYGHLNLMKTGLTFADYVTTVSPTYAEEIQTADYGEGLDGVLRNRHERLVGILNGIDTSVWNPATDPLIEANYDAETVFAHKARNREWLLEYSRLSAGPRTPLIGMVSRMSQQKGIDLICAAAGQFLQQDLRLCILGTGDHSCEEQLRHLVHYYPEQVSVKFDFDEGLAHRIEAGADAFLMPSQYEPCGLNQMYSLRYGTPPIVHATGGLADSVTDTTDATLSNGTATGFAFRDYDPVALTDAIARMGHRFTEGESWQQIVRTGMQLDWSWNRSAAEYERIYRLALAQKEQRV